MGSPEEVTEEQRIAANVTDRLLKAGLDMKLAIKLADRGADVREVERLVQSGCPHHLIEGIVL